MHLSFAACDIHVLLITSSLI